MRRRYTLLVRYYSIANHYALRGSDAVNQYRYIKLRRALLSGVETQTRAQLLLIQPHNAVQLEGLKYGNGSVLWKN